MAAAKLVPRYRHWADLHLQGRDQAQIAEVAGVNASTVSRALRRPEVRGYIERQRAKKNKSTTLPTQHQRLESIDLQLEAKRAALSAWAALRKRQQAGDDVSVSDLVRTAEALRKFAESDSSATSPGAVAAALADKKTLAAVVEALDPAESQRVWEVLAGRVVRDLGLEDADTRAGFQHVERVLVPEVAGAWCHRWRPVIALMKRDAARLEAWHAHLAVAQQHGDEPDVESVDAVYGDVTPIDELISMATAITAKEEADNAA
ncbi:MAG: hypothetical protein ACE37F_13080 [Nannocystaceae bacterium]|nr:MarR family transcriptional regulator [bacterium]